MIAALPCRKLDSWQAGTFDTVRWVSSDVNRLLNVLLGRYWFIGMPGAHERQVRLMNDRD